MRKCLLLIAIATLACDAKKPAAEKHGAFDAASGITRVQGSGARIVPLHAMTGDVEVISGDPEKPGPFVMRIHELPGTRIPLHTHPVDENITIVQGTWYFAVADRWDPKLLTPLHVGDYAYAPKGSSMFAYCPDGAIVQLHGVGPYEIHWRHGLQTLDDPGPRSPFTFRKGEHVACPRGRGIIRQGYASGDIVQLEIGLDGGTVVMADQTDVHR
jgi:quercetin dioxygenase-like cupin family protein